MNSTQQPKKILTSWFDIMESDEEEERLEKLQEQMNKDKKRYFILAQIRTILLHAGHYELEDGEIL
jgi:hypothetical protein